MSQTRKKRGGALFNFLKKKAPVTANTTPLITATKNNSTVMYGRSASLNNWVTKKQKKAEAARKIRNQVKTFKAASPSVMNNAYKLMDNASRNRTKRLMNYKNINSLSNDQLLNLYFTGKVRSASQ